METLTENRTIDEDLLKEYGFERDEKFTFVVYTRYELMDVGTRALSAMQHSKNSWDLIILHIIHCREPIGINMGEFKYESELKLLLQGLRFK